MNGLREPWLPRQGSDLTPREQAVLREAASGLPDKIIADRMGLAEASVAANLDRAFRRLGVHSRIEAFRAVGWLQVPE